MEAAPYDNVEFGPIQRGGKTGTWPGPQGQQQSVVTQQHTSRGLQQTKGGGVGVGVGAASRLAPLEESNAEVVETRDQRMQAVTQHASSSFATSSSQAQKSATSGFSASSGTSAFPGVGTRSANSGVSGKLMSLHTDVNFSRPR